MPQKLFGIKGTVTKVVAGTATAVRGAKVWAVNLSSKKLVNTVDDYTYALTDANGRYILEAGDVSTTLATGNTVRVTCQCGDDKDYADVTVTSGAGATQDFAFNNSSGLTDALKDTPRADGKQALHHNALIKGCKDAMN